MLWHPSIPALHSVLLSTSVLLFSLLIFSLIAPRLKVSLPAGCLNWLWKLASFGMLPQILFSLLRTAYSILPCLSLSIQDQASKDKALQTVANLSSAQIVSASVMKPQPSFPPPVRVRTLHTDTHHRA